MDLSPDNLYEQNNYNNYPHNNMRAKKSRKLSPNKKKSFINNNNILQFSLNSINNILINNLNSSVSLGFLNLTNNEFFPKKLNNNLYINSLYDSIDYKIRGNIYKQDKYMFMNNFPNLSGILRNNSYKNRNEIKIMKFDKEIINIKNKTPIKKLNKNYYLNLMRSNKDNSNKYKHYKNNSENIDNNIDDENDENFDIKKSKINNNYDKYTIYRQCATINSKDKSRQIYQNNNLNKNTFIKKISPNKMYIINKTTTNSKEKNIRENQTKLIEPKNKIVFKNKFIYKDIKTEANSPKKLIILNNKKIENIIKNKNKEITNNKPNLIIQNKLPKQIKHEHCQSYNINSYKPIPKTERNTYYNINNNSIINNSANNKVNNTNNKNIIIKRNTNTNMNQINKIKYLTLTNIHNSKNEKNKNLNIPYSPPNSKLNNNNNIEISSKPKNKNKYVLCNHKMIINNRQNIKNVNKENKNKVFNDDENSIFKVIDNTQIMTPDEFNNSKNSNSLTNSNKLYQLNGSNGTNTNQDTDYNSIKKFNTNKFLTNEDLMKDNYYNNSGNDVNFSFNNLHHCHYYYNNYPSLNLHLKDNN